MFVMCLIFDMNILHDLFHRSMYQNKYSNFIIRKNGEKMQFIIEQKRAELIDMLKSYDVQGAIQKSLF